MVLNMGKIFYLMGKSASGKDTIYKELINDDALGLKEVVMYSTRPIRSGETDGVDYFFVSQDELDKQNAAGKLIESRTYNTVHGPWTYATVDDGQIDLANGNYLMVGVLSAYALMKKYYGEENVFPLYIEVEDGLRLERALAREKEGTPRYAEMCRRFLADSEDFSEENLAKNKITTRYNNEVLEDCLLKIREEILKNISKDK